VHIISRRLIMLLLFVKMNKLLIETLKYWCVCQLKTEI